MLNMCQIFSGVKKFQAWCVLTIGLFITGSSRCFDLTHRADKQIYQSSSYFYLRQLENFKRPEFILDVSLLQFLTVLFWDVSNIKHISGNWSRDFFFQSFPCCFVAMNVRCSTLNMKNSSDAFLNLSYTWLPHCFKCILKTMLCFPLYLRLSIFNIQI